MNNILHSTANKTCAHLYICMHVSKTKTYIVMKPGYEIVYILHTAECLQHLFSSFVLISLQNIQKKLDTQHCLYCKYSF